MNQRIQRKIEEYKKMARSHNEYAVPPSSIATRKDSLAAVIRSKKDADVFMAELESIARRSK